MSGIVRGFVGLLTKRSNRRSADPVASSVRRYGLIFCPSRHNSALSVNHGVGISIASVMQSFLF